MLQQTRSRGALGESLLEGVLTGHPTPPTSVRSVAAVDNRAEVREFLVSRRAKITPQQAGLPDVGSRRVPGLRRGEVAALAGVSVEYYAKLERGALGRRLRLRPRRARPRPAARRRRTRPPVPPRPRRRRHQRRHAAPPPRRPRPWTPRPALQLGARRHHRTGDHPQRPDGPARHQPPRPGHARLRLRPRPGDPPNFARYTFLDDDCAPLLPRLGPRRRHLRRDPADRGRPRPPRQGPARPGRRAVHPQRRVPPPLGHATTSASTAPAPSTSTTPSSATSTSPTKAST